MPTFCVMFLLAAFVGVVVFLVKAEQVKALDLIYQRLAQRYGGQFFRGTLFRRPSVTFKRHGVDVLIDSFSTGGKHPKYYTQCHVAWPDAFLRCVVCPENFFRRLGKGLLGMKDIQIGVPRFDDDYHITGNDENAIREFLTNDMRQRIDGLRRFLGNDDIYIAVSAGKLLIKKRGLIREYQLLEQFANMSLELYQAAVAAKSEGILFVKRRDRTADPLDAMCQICGDSITEDVVLCRSCKTPHHRDCWQYYGACSTYGCGQTSFLYPRGSKKRQQA